MDGRRAKLVRISEAALLDCFDRRLREGMDGYVTRMTFAALPDGCTVQRAFHDSYRRCFCIVVGHPSFEEVPDGQQVPDFCDYNLGVRYDAVRYVEAEEYQQFRQWQEQQRGRDVVSSRTRIETLEEMTKTLSVVFGPNLKPLSDSEWNDPGHPLAKKWEAMRLLGDAGYERKPGAAGHEEYEQAVEFVMGRKPEDMVLVKRDEHGRQTVLLSANLAGGWERRATRVTGQLIKDEDGKLALKTEGGAYLTGLPSADADAPTVVKAPE